MSKTMEEKYYEYFQALAVRALQENDLNDDDLAKFFANNRRFGDDIVASVRELSLGPQYKDEEAKSIFSHEYGCKYHSKDVAEQVGILQSFFPQLNGANLELVRSLPPKAEGWFAIPRWQSIAKTYNDAVKMVFELLKSQRKIRFMDFSKKQFSKKYLRRSEKTTQAFELIGQKQLGYDILLIPAQFGLLHGGRSKRRALAVMNKDEFGLGIYEVIVMLLLHPERLTCVNDLNLECCGDIFSPYDIEPDDYDCSIYFSCHGQIVLTWSGDDVASENAGSVSGFIVNDDIEYK